MCLIYAFDPENQCDFVLTGSVRRLFGRTHRIRHLLPAEQSEGRIPSLKIGIIALFVTPSDLEAQHVPVEVKTFLIIRDQQFSLSQLETEVGCDERVGSDQYEPIEPGSQVVFHCPVLRFDRRACQRDLFSKGFPRRKASQTMWDSVTRCPNDLTPATIRSLLKRPWNTTSKRNFGCTRVCDGKLDGVTLSLFASNILLNM